MIAITLPLATEMQAVRRWSGSRVGSSSPAGFPCHRLDLEIGANLFADCTCIEIGWYLYRFVEVKQTLGLLQWYAAILDSVADGHGIGAVGGLSVMCVAPPSLQTVIFRTAASAAIP
jgi:hypothetical protein